MAVMLVLCILCAVPGLLSCACALLLSLQDDDCQQLLDEPGCVAMPSTESHISCLCLALLCLQDDDCQELLDGPGHPGCASGPLAYDLTQHTGSYMYMAPVSDSYNQGFSA
jgi:hypothetical protein